MVDALWGGSRQTHTGRADMGGASRLLPGTVKSSLKWSCYVLFIMLHLQERAPVKSSFTSASAPGPLRVSGNWPSPLDKKPCLRSPHKLLSHFQRSHLPCHTLHDDQACSPSTLQVHTPSRARRCGGGGREEHGLGFGTLGFSS